MNADQPTRLNATAVALLEAIGVSVRDFALYYWADGVWHGDTCGCPDDRCAGHHHAEGVECCECFSAEYDDLKERQYDAMKAARREPPPPSGTPSRA
ncbi:MULTISPECIES: hypothetical protein [Cellulomonas]|uniref:Uncharacterized protein n=1 Tax=Cellulomonas denverensis TaxID=264297 RepID=A0A7X6KY45_9CELL|nr:MULTISPECIES: hypothetical protein [Cellulomonas]NKY24318.1 hypothetical protein [Cellulomonas denverensis]QZN87812.1 hypothetical protein K5O09_18640 [Cellulomonas sp. C5510]GIG27291.1 hypothetical protein Cde04nite_35350 [Cellulomonas denverensis]